MALHKATAIVTVYFETDQKNQKLLLSEAEQHLRQELWDVGPDSDPRIVRVTGAEEPAGNWELEAEVYGSDPPMTLREAMMRAAKESRALPQTPEKKEIH